jgi:transcriptional regulator with GAF, ATPase, and Fis domain
LVALGFMEPGSDSRFDPNYAAQLLLEVAHEQSVEQLLRKLVWRAVERSGLACAQVWLIDKGDLCASCPQRAECADPTRCLHLAAGTGPGGSEPEREARYGDRRARNPLGVGLLGKVAAAGEQLVLKDLDQHAGEIVGFDRLRQDGIHGATATPIMFRGEVLGVVAGFSRSKMAEETRPWGRIFADHIGAAIANARAFEEIQRLKAQLELQNTYLQEEVVEAKAFGDLVGKSGALRQLVRQIDLVAPTEASVLILGETGTGKELVAHEIHRRSQRKRGPLVRVNCASIPRELFESEFFGHVRGSFTGAIRDRAGRFETAEGGTLFLDEIGELPLEMQSKLLRFLQEKKYERIGDDRTRQADVRIIGATNRDLKKAVAAGRFREDLFYRLHVFPIQVAPLRSRKEDIPLLAKHFVDVSVRELKCARPRLTRAAVAALLNYDWPGNVRELRNVIERAVILARGESLNFDLPVRGRSSASFPAPLGQVQDGTSPVSKLMTEAELRGLERDNLVATLGAAKWKVRGPGGAAELLGVKPTTLYSRMQKLGIKPPDAEQAE